jgi:hypothetical protein
MNIKLDMEEGTFCFTRNVKLGKYGLYMGLGNRGVENGI